MSDTEDIISVDAEPDPETIAYFKKWSAQKRAEKRRENAGIVPVQASPQSVVVWLGSRETRIMPNQDIDSDSVRETTNCPCYALTDVLPYDYDFSKVTHICRLTQQVACQRWALPFIANQDIKAALAWGVAAFKAAVSGTELPKEILPLHYSLTLPDMRSIVVRTDTVWPFPFSSLAAILPNIPRATTTRGLVMVFEQYIDGRSTIINRLKKAAPAPKPRIYEPDEVMASLGVKAGTYPPRAKDYYLPHLPSTEAYLKGETPRYEGGRVSTFIIATISPDPTKQLEPAEVIQSIVIPSAYINDETARQGIKISGQHIELWNKKPKHGGNIPNLKEKPGPKQRERDAAIIASSATEDEAQAKILEDATQKGGPFTPKWPQKYNANRRFKKAKE